MIGQINRQKSKFSTIEYQSEEPNTAREGLADFKKNENYSNNAMESNFSRHSILFPESNCKPLKERVKKVPLIPINTILTEEAESSEEYGQRSANQSPARTSRHSIINFSPGGRRNSVKLKNMGPAGSPFRYSGLGKPGLSRISSMMAMSEFNYQENKNIWDSSMGPKIDWVLQKQLKTKEDAEFIYQTIQNFSFFSKFVTQNLGDLEEEAIFQLCKHMKFETFSAGEWVFQEGDVSNDKLYIILSGRVTIIFQNDRNVFFQENMSEVAESVGLSPQRGNRSSRENSPLPKKNDEPKTPLPRGIDSVTRSNSLHSGNIKSSVSSFLTEAEVLFKSESSKKSPKIVKSGSKRSLQIKPITTPSPLLHIELGEGEAFGEKALTSKDSKRTASIMAKTDCKLIILMKEDYLSIVGRYNKENHFKLDFLKQNIPYMDRINSTHILEDLLYLFNAEFFKRGKKFVEEDKVGNKIYLLVNGECTIEKRVLNEKTDVSKNLFMVKIYPPAIIGEELLFEGKGKDRTYKYTVKVDSLEAKLYYCDLTGMKMRFPKESIRVIRNNYYEKEKLRSQRMNFVQQVEDQSHNRENIELKILLKFATKGTRASLVSKSLDAVNRARAETDTQQLMVVKKKIDTFSRAYPAIKKDILKKAKAKFNNNDQPADFNDTGFQPDQEDFPQIGQADRAGYEPRASRTNLPSKPSGLRTARDTWQSECFSTRTLPASPVREESEAQPSRSSNERQSLKLVEKNMNELNETNHIKFGERNLQRRAQSIIDFITTNKEGLPGPHAARRHQTKRNLVIRKFTTEEDNLLLPEKDHNAFEKVNEKNSKSRYLSLLSQGIGDEFSKETGASVTQKEILGKKRKNNAAKVKNTHKDNAPFLNNVLTHLYTDEKAKYIRGRLESMANEKDHPKFASDFNELRNMKKPVLDPIIAEGSLTCRDSVSTKGILLGSLNMETNVQSEVGSQFKQQTSIDLLQSLDLTKRFVNNKADHKKKSQNSSPIPGKSQILEPLVLSPRFPIAIQLEGRAGGKTTAVKSLKEKSLQMKALHSGHRMADSLKLYD